MTEEFEIDDDLHPIDASEHPSGLRDAIERGIRDHECPPWNEPRVGMINYIERSVVAWLSVVSEEEIADAARAICVGKIHGRATTRVPYGACENCKSLARFALAASREVLIPKEPT